MPSVTGRAPRYQFFKRFQGPTRLIDTQPFQLLDSEEQIRVALETLPPSLMRKVFRTWRKEATFMCGEFAHALRMHLRPPQPIIPLWSSDDDSSRESDDEEPSRLTPPPKFKCQGIITKWNDNPATVMEID